MTEIILKSGCVITLNGIPFELKEDTKVATSLENFMLFLSHDEQSVS